MKIAVKVLLLFVIFSILLIYVNCDVFKCNCDDEMEKVRDKMGEPEEVNRYDSSNYHSVDWWYWTKGICYTFTWGSIVEGCCEVSTYQFEPIHKESSKTQLKEKL